MSQQPPNSTSKHRIYLPDLSDTNRMTVTPMGGQKYDADSKENQTRKRSVWWEWPHQCGKGYTGTRLCNGTQNCVLTSHYTQAPTMLGILSLKDTQARLCSGRSLRPTRTSPSPYSHCWGAMRGSCSRSALRSGMGWKQQVHMAWLPCRVHT